MNPQAFRAHLLDELDAVYRMAMHLARDPHEAADLAQQTFARALGAADRFELGERGMRPWLLKILHNCFYSRKNRERRGPVFAADLEPYGSDPATEPATTDLGDVDTEQLDDRLKHAIDALQDKYRIVLLLWAVEGLKYREIADTLDLPIGTVMSRLSRARRILSAELEELAQETGVLGRPTSIAA